MVGVREDVDDVARPDLALFFEQIDQLTQVVRVAQRVFALNLNVWILLADAGECLRIGASSQKEPARLPNSALVGRGDILDLLFPAPDLASVAGIEVSSWLF